MPCSATRTRDEFIITFGRQFRAWGYGETLIAPIEVVTVGE